MPRTEDAGRTGKFPPFFQKLKRNRHWSFLENPPLFSDFPKKMEKKSEKNGKFSKKSAQFLTLIFRQFLANFSKKTRKNR